MLQETPASIDLDCSALALVSSRHIELLWLARDKCLSAGVALRLRATTPRLKRILEILDLTDLFEVERDQSDYRESGTFGSTESLQLEYVDRSEPSPAAVTSATFRFKAFLEQLPVPELVRFDLVTVFYEAANNICEHGKIPSGRSIEFAAHSSCTGMIMEFRDNGIAYDPTTHRQEKPQVALSQRGRRGYGLSLIRRMTDSVTYQRTVAGENILTLVRRWGIDA